MKNGHRELKTSELVVVWINIKWKQMWGEGREGILDIGDWLVKF